MEDASSLPSTPVERSSSPPVMADDSSLPSSPVEQSSSPSVMADDISLPSSPVEQSSNPPALPDWVIRMYEAYRSRKAQEFDYMRFQAAIEELPREEDSLYVIQLIQMYKGPDTYIEDNIEEDGEFFVDLSTLPDDLKMKIWNYLLRRELVG